MTACDYIVVGGNISSMICARELAHQGATVVLAATPSSLGGHFSTYHTLDHDFDLGMVLLEFDSYMTQSTELSDFDPEVLGNIGQFTKQVEAYIARHISHRPVADILVARNGRLLSDYFISNDLDDIFMSLRANERARVESELRSCIRENLLHPRCKAESPAYATASYAQCSLANHGQFLHSNFMDPLVHKATNTSSGLLSGQFHRLFWAPLFYPETLLQHLTTGTSPLVPTTFSYPQGSTGVHALTDSILRQMSLEPSLHALDSLDSLSRSGSTWNINDRFSAPALITSLPQAKILRLLDLPYSPLTTGSYALVFIELSGPCDVNVITNADENFIFYRLSNSSRIRSRKGETSHLVVEYNYDYAISTDRSFFSSKRYVEDILGFLETYDLGTPPSIVRHHLVCLAGSMSFPTMDNVRRSDENRERLREVTGLHPMGSSLGIGSRSLNHQIIQSLHYVESQSLNHE